MQYLAIAFRSRAETVKFSELLSANRISNEIINTPKDAGVGCGLSCKVSVNYFSVIKNAIRKMHFTSFAGVFLVKSVGGKRIVTTI